LYPQSTENDYETKQEFIMSALFGENTTQEIIRSLENGERPAALLAARHAIQDLLQNFNPGVEASFRLGGMDHMQPLCTAAGFERMQQKYAAWRARNISALNLVSCDFLSFDLDDSHPDRATAFTFEKWVFVYENGEFIPTRGSVDFYELRLEDGFWKVDSAVTYAREPES
jgi:hypothetical protein